VFVCICAAYLFGGLVKDRIAARYRRASLIDPLTGVMNRRGFLQAGERLMVRTRFAGQPTALLIFDLDVSRTSMTDSGTVPVMRCLLHFVS
jgi:GGDEF domain-containing protein